MDDDEALELPSLWHEAEEDINHGKFHKAIEIYKYILIRYGDSNSAAECAHARLGNIFLMLGRTNEGENHIRKALSYDLEENHFCHYLLGFIYQQRYEWNNAIQEYRLALACNPWNRGYLHALGVAVFNSGDKEKGLEYLHQVVPLYPENSGMLAQLATAYMSIGDMTSAREYAEEAVRTNPADIMAHAVLQRINKEAGDTPH